MLSKTVLNKIEKYAKKGKLVMIDFADTNASHLPSKMPKNPDRVYFTVNISCGLGKDKFEVTKKIKIDDLRELDKLYHTYENILLSGCLDLDLVIVIEDTYGCGYVFDPRR